MRNPNRPKHPRPEPSPPPPPKKGPTVRVVVEGQSTVAVCETCRSQVPAKYLLRDFPLTNPPTIVPNILVAVCDRCEEIVAIPNQSCPQIKEADRARVLRVIEDAEDLYASKEAMKEEGGVPWEQAKKELGL